MNKKYLLGSGKNTARLARILAKSIDLGGVLFLTIFIYPYGLILGLVYLAFSDSLYDGQSFGKKLIGFKVISLEDGSPCSFKQSLVRNTPFLISFAMAIIPFWGWIIAAILLPVICFFELYLLLKLDSAHRLGDVVADTTVVAGGADGVDIKKYRQSWFENKNTCPLN